MSLQAGEELYFHNDAVLWVYDSATLEVHGTSEQPVLFTSVRQDGRYKTLPGQWGYVWLSKGSCNNVIDHACIENAYVGLLIDSCSNSNPTVRISNTQILNHSYAGIISQTAYVEGDNMLVANCGTATVVMQYGGDYTFTNSTFANYWRYDTRKYPSVFVVNTRNYSGVHYVWPLQARMSDCIIYGNRVEGEMYVELENDLVEASLVLNHCLVRGGEWDEDPKFVDPTKNDYHLAEDSPAIGIGYRYGDESQDTVSSILKNKKLKNK